MNHLVVKLKGGIEEIYKLLSTNNLLFEHPEDLAQNRNYDVDYSLDEDEWFSIESFSEQDYCIDFLRRRFLSTDYNQVATNNYVNIEYFCFYRSGNYYFQKVNKSQFIQKKIISFSNEPEIVENPALIVIHDLPDAIYIKEEDTLYFKKLTSITSIFKGIDVLYREATEEQTTNFLMSAFIQLEGDYTAEKVKKANRKRIALAMETLSHFTPNEKQTIFGYIREYCEDLNFDENQENFSISSEEELKKLLYGIEQRYYTTRLGGEKRLANSITPL